MNEEATPLNTKKSTKFGCGVFRGEMSQQLEKEVSEALNFKEPLYINQRSFLIHKYKPLEGGFPGARIYQLVGLLKAAVYEMNGVRRLDRGWFLDREIKTKFLSYFHLQMAYNKSKNSLERIEEVKKKASAVLSEAYTKSVVDEWIKDKLDDKVTEAEGYVTKYNALIKQYTANVD